MGAAGVCPRWACRQGVPSRDRIRFVVLPKEMREGYTQVLVETVGGAMAELQNLRRASIVADDSRYVLWEVIQPPP